MMARRSGGGNGERKITTDKSQMTKAVLGKSLRDGRCSGAVCTLGGVAFEMTKFTLWLAGTLALPLALSRDHRREGAAGEREFDAGGDGFAEEGMAGFSPGEALGVDVAIVPAALFAGFGVIQNPVFCAVGGLHKGAMAHAPDFGVAFENGRFGFSPIGAVANVAAGKFEKAQAVVRSPTAARRVNKEEFTVTIEDLRAFADRHLDGFPGMFGCGEESTFATNGPWVFHRRDVKVLEAVDRAGPT